MNIMIKPPRMESIAETSKLSGIPAYTLRRWFSEGKIIGVKCGRKILLNVDRLVDFLNNNVENSYNQEENHTSGGIQPIKLR